MKLNLILFRLLCCVLAVLSLSQTSSAEDKRAEDLQLLGKTAFYEGRYAESEQYLRRSIGMFEAKGDSARTELAITRGYLGWLLAGLGNHAEAEKLMQSALKTLNTNGNEHCDQNAMLLSHFGTLYQKTGRQKKAESSYKEALRRAERCAPAYVELILNNMGIFYGENGKLKQAAAVLERALAMREQLGLVNEPVMAQTLTSLAAVYQVQQKLSLAEPLLLRAREFLQASLEREHPDLSVTLLSFTLEELGLLYYRQGKLEEAEQQLRQAMNVEPLHPTPDPRRNARLSFVLAQILTVKGEYELAKSLYQKALPGKDSNTAQTAETLEQYSTLLRLMKADKQAAELTRRAKSIRDHLAYTTSVK